MTYAAKPTLYSDIRTKHSAQSEHHVECLNVKPRWYGNKPLGIKRLRVCGAVITAYCDRNRTASCMCD